MNLPFVPAVATNGVGISCLAFQLWEKAGCPEGRDLGFWLEGETHVAEWELAKTSQVAHLGSAAAFKEIQIRESTLTPIVQDFLRFRTMA
jgi:hypothetical protein